MKRKTAKEILAASFRELAGRRPIDKITIREIVDNCGYSPATFYRNYRDKYDLIAWDYAQGTAGIMGRIGEVWLQANDLMKVIQLKTDFASGERHSVCWYDLEMESAGEWKLFDHLCVTVEVP